MSLFGYSFTIDQVLSILAWAFYGSILFGVWRQVRKLVFIGLVGVITIFLWGQVL